MKIGFIGSGAWASALANVASDNKHDVVIYGINEDEVRDINLNHQNKRYFKEVYLNKNIRASLNINDAVSNSDVIVLATPSSQIRIILEQIKPLINSKPVILNVSKGFDSETFKRLSEVIKENLADDLISGVVTLIGPSYADEVVIRYFTAISAVSSSLEASQKIQTLFSNEYFRVYTNEDEIGAEVGAGIKNVIAIASGILYGLGYKDNSRAALITRGLAEITRYGEALGANQKTFLGLTGIGDLFLTCSSFSSRNFSAGVKIGELDSADDFFKVNTKTIEGVYAAKIIYEASKKMGIDMPITEAVYRVLYLNEKPSEIVVKLMRRELKSE